MKNLTKSIFSIAIIFAVLSHIDAQSCTSSANCTNGKNICSSGQCVQCTDNAHCTFNPKGPTCNITKQCGCSSSNQCTVDTYGSACISGSCRCQSNIGCASNTNGPICKYDLKGNYCGCYTQSQCAMLPRADTPGSICRTEPNGLNDLDGRRTCGCNGTSNGCTTTNRQCSPVRGVCFCNSTLCPTATPFCKSTFPASTAFLDRRARCVECLTNANCPITLSCISNICAQCTQDSHCADFQSCNTTSNLCICNTTRCGTSKPGFTCSAQTTTGVCSCSVTACALLSRVCVNDGESRCARTCTNTSSFQTTQCPTNQFCHNDGTTTACRSNSISCLNGTTRDSSKCPTGLYCQKANTQNDINSATCVPLCNDANDFCKGFDCPANFRYSVAGQPCTRDEDNSVNVCSCLDPSEQ